ncbi:BTAD domain-containing putative transcriptional regulator [Kitasatospora arboriphila]
MGRSQQQAFLAMLLAHPGRPLTAARLAEGIFDEDNPPARPRSVLATHAYRLRRTLRNHHADHLLVTVDGGYRLDVPAESLDSVAFDRLVARAEDLRIAADRPRARDLLARALALHEGEPLAGLPGGHAVELRRHLAERRVAVLEAKLALDVDLGDNPSCLVELDQAVFAHPFRERFRALLMLEYHLADRPAEARAVYADARRDYHAEGLDCPELDALHARIRRADPTLGTATRLVGRSVAAHDPPVPDRGADSGRLPVPEQLPTPLVDFTGSAGRRRGADRRAHPPRPGRRGHLGSQRNRGCRKDQPGRPRRPRPARAVPRRPTAPGPARRPGRPARPGRGTRPAAGLARRRGPGDPGRPGRTRRALPHHRG